MDPSKQVRIIGAVKLALGMGVFLLIWRLGYVVLSPLVFVVALSGLLEVLTGVSWRTTASRWSTLRPWQRGVASVLVVIATVGLFVLVGALLLKMNE
jgi:hypothetical protein